LQKRCLRTAELKAGRRPPRARATSHIWNRRDTGRWHRGTSRPAGRRAANDADRQQYPTMTKASQGSLTVALLKSESGAATTTELRP